MSNSPFLSNCSAETIRDAAAALKAGHLVAFPTETVYGLGADARNPDAVKRIYEVKSRPTDHPLIVHISSINQVERWASEIPDYAIALARAFWPGPMTIILKRSDLAGDFITGGQDTIGLRVPSDPIAAELICEFEKISDSAIVAPSANRFGQVSPTSSADVYEELGAYLAESDIILAGGNSSIGIESTIIDCTNVYPQILRPGFITRQDMKLDPQIRFETEEIITNTKFSGSFEKHYSPNCKIILDTQPAVGQAFLALECIPTPNGVFRIASPRDVIEYSRVLYSSFRLADKLNFSELYVLQPAGYGIAEAIRDRLLKASN